MTALRDFAVVIGINEYEHPDLPRLRGAGNDASAFVEWLKDPCSDGELSDGQIIKRLKVATFSDLGRAFNELLGNVGSGGRRLYIFVAGHGSGQGVKDAYVYTSDHARYVEACWDIIRNADALGRLFLEIVVFMDCCRTDMPEGHSSPLALKIAQAQSPGTHFYCFAASAGDMTKEEMFEGRIRGVFSGHLLRALHGQVESAVDHQGRVTAHTLRSYLTKSVGLKPDFDPPYAQDLRKIVLAKGFAPARRLLTIQLSDPTTEGCCGVFNGLDLAPLPWKRTRENANTILLDREEECLIVLTLPDVSDIREATRPKAVLPEETVVSL